MNSNILVAEPSSNDWTAIAKGIRKRLPLASILRVKDGEQALRFALHADLLTPATRTPSLVLLAAQLPLVSGEHVLAELRKHPRTRSIPVLIAWKDAYNSKVERLEAFKGDEWLFTVLCTVALEDQVADAVRRIYEAEPAPVSGFLHGRRHERLHREPRT